MTLAPVMIEQFAGLNLIDDPPEVGLSAAIDLLDVDFDRRGRVRQRDGFDNLSSSAAAGRLAYLTPYYTAAGAKQLLVTQQAAANTNAVLVYNTSGTTDATYGDVVNPGPFGQGIRFGSTSTNAVYIPGANGSGATALKWNGAAFSTVAAIPTADHFAIQATDNRMVAANIQSALSKVVFSNAGDPETWTAADFVQITPGDGEQITALAAWGELVLAFKETKFAVFYGNTTDTTGGSIFNYRMVNSGDGTTGTVCTGRPGVFFLNRRGIYLTTGGVPTLISRQIDPIFSGQGLESYSGSALNKAQITKASMCWLGERLYVSIPTGSSTTNNRLLVWDSLLDQWTVWSIPAGGLATFRVSDTDELVFSYATGSNHVGRVSSSFTTDDGTSIASFYQSGFFDGGSEEEKRVKRTRVHGTGSVGFSVATDYGAPDTAQTLVLGTSPAVGQAADLVARWGRLFSFKLGSVSGGAWQSRRLVMYLADVTQPGLSSG